MSALEQIRPLVSFCQACGLIPYTMVYEPINKKFLKFIFCWKNVTTWWFLFVSISQIVIPLMMSLIGKEMVGKIRAEKQAPVTVVISMTVTMVCYVGQFFLIRWSILRNHQKLQNAVRSALEVEKFLGKTWHTFQNSINRRFTIGFSLIVITVRSSLNLTTYEQNSNKNTDVFL